MANRVRRVGVHEAKTHLSKLLRDVEAGTEIVVMRGDQAVARIVRISSSRLPASYGMFSNQFIMADDFESDSDELADAFGVPR